MNKTIPLFIFLILTAVNSKLFAQNLDQRLAQATRNFINDPEKVFLNRQENVVYLSSIFDWYKTDFTVTKSAEKQFEKYDPDERGIIQFVPGYLPEADQRYIVENQPTIK